MASLRCLSYSAAITLTSVVSAQESVKVDYELIRQRVQDRDSQLFYPTLLSRFVVGDTSMTADELRHCYYGYTFQEGYQSHKRAKAIDLVDSLVVKYPMRIDTNRVHQLIDSALMFCPFDLNALLYRIRFTGRAYGKEASLSRWKIEAISRAIEGSGDGLSKRTAYSVIYIPHEHLMIHLRGLSRTGQQSLGRNEIDVIDVAPSDTKIKSLCFDVSGMRIESDPTKVLYHQYYHAYLNMHPLPLSLVR